MAPIHSFFPKMFYAYAQEGLARLQVMASAPVQAILATKSDLINFLILLVIFYFSFLILVSTVKTVFRVVVNVVKLLFFVALLLVIVWVYIRGIDGCVQDVNYIVSTGQHADLYGEGSKFTLNVQAAARKQFSNFMSQISL